jgi:S-adenosylmethionine:tRNA ribosyltransferase-isomerase
MIGNLKKWKTGELVKKVLVKGKEIDVRAEKLEQVGENHLVRFTWNDAEATFADILEAGGVLPIPPYLHRETEESDLRTYQTVYSKIKGSVAAPTAGLHFTPEVLAEVDKRGIGREEVTLHVGAGTFKPVKSETIEHHTMHTEFISVRKEAIERIKENLGKVIAVGTTSVRTLETLYYVGVILSRDEDPTEEEMIVSQWMPYSEENNRLTTEEALDNILRYLERHQLPRLVTATRILIAPGYGFHVVRGIVTNFHQPKSTLLLLVSAFVDGDWKSIYDYALGHGFRFLSYGDSSLLLRE